ncbi:unnamed protein product [Coregonus sp. 'balchen']|nr:unnamed protein product [Coregonus sp. 'balchen']
MGQVCAVCMGPLTFQEDCEEELDSSDDEQLGLWTAALTSPHITHRGTRRLMKRRISMATRRWPSESRVQRGACSSIGLVEGDSGNSDGSSGHISPPSDSEHSEPDMTYQDYSEQHHSEPSDHDYDHNPNLTLSLSVVCVSGGLETQGFESDTSDSDASFHSVTSGRINHSQDGSLRTVTVHSLDHNSQPQLSQGSS